MECPLCGQNHDHLMNRPALNEIGWNPKSGVLYRCNACGSRVTEAQIETGEEDVLTAVEVVDSLTPYSQYKNEA